MSILKLEYNAATTPALFAKSLRETGFAVISDHTISPDLIRDVYAEWQDFFNSSAKHQYLFKRETQAGYFPMTVAEKAKGHDVIDIKEFFSFYPWGQFPKELSNKTSLLYHQLNEMGQTLLRWIEEYLPSAISSKLAMPLGQMVVDSPKTMLRILHYPPLTGQEPAGAVRAAAHEDIDLLTLLIAGTQPGLQVKNKAGQWVNVPCDPNNIVINAGDMLQMCTEGYYPSTTHQVINPPGEQNVSRLSIPLFLHPHDEIRLSTNYTAGEYLQERLRELGLI